MNLVNSYTYILRGNRSRVLTEFLLSLIVFILLTIRGSGAVGRAGSVTACAVLPNMLSHTTDHYFANLAGVSVASHRDRPAAWLQIQVGLALRPNA